MSALAFPTAPLTLPARRRHLVAVPDLPVAEPAVPLCDTAAPGDGGRAAASRTGERRAVATSTAPLRLTARGRAVLVALAFLVAAALGAGAGLVFPAQEPMPEQVQSVTVAPGESLWTIAESVAADGQDVRIVVDQIMELNNLAAATVHAGQDLTVPAGS